MIGQRIQDERKRLNLNQQEMADLCGITSRSQRNYENGERTPDANYLAAAKAAGADIRYITEGLYRFQEIGKRLIEERFRIEKNTRDMASLGGVSVEQQKRFEKGLDQPPAEYLNRLFAETGVGIWYILTGEFDPDDPRRSPDERLLISYYRKSSSEDRQALLRMAKNSARNK